MKNSFCRATDRANCLVGWAALIAVGGALAPASAEAGGLYISQRGVRPLGRGGAFVAGADDLGAMTYNPAGLFDAGEAILIDGTLTLFGSQYSRQAFLRQVDPNTGETVATYEQTFPTVEGEAAPLPIPTLAGSFSPHPDWVLAFGVHAPTAVLSKYPAEVDGAPAAQRYQLLSMEGSLLANVGAYVAWRPVDELRIGLGVEVLVGAFKSRQVLSGCLPDRFFCSPEDPSWDLEAEINAAPIVTPTGIVGATWEFYPGWRLGGSFHLPYYIDAPATLRSRLPEAAPYRTSEVLGESANVVFQLPWEARLGLEVRDLVKGLRIEVAGDYQHWQMHDQISVRPDAVAITNLPGFPKEYYLPDIAMPRGFQGSIAAMLGAEYTIEASSVVSVTPRLGVSYETSAVPSEYLSVLTLDSGKATPSVGASIGIGDARFDLVYAHQFIQPVTVDSKSARLAQVVPVQANPSDHPNTINGGVYSWHVDIVGLGFSYTFSRPVPTAGAAAPAVPDAEPPKAEPRDKSKTETPSEAKDIPPKDDAADEEGGADEH